MAALFIETSKRFKNLGAAHGSLRARCRHHDRKGEKCPLNLWGKAIFHGPRLFLGPALVGALIAFDSD